MHHVLKKPYVEVERTFESLKKMHHALKKTFMEAAGAFESLKTYSWFIML